MIKFAAIAAPIFTSIMLHHASALSRPQSASNFIFYKTRSDYNLICKYKSGEVLINNYRYQVAISSHLNQNFLLYFETLLVEPDASCKECFDLTIQSADSYQYVYLIELRKKSTYKAEIFSISDVGERYNITPEIKCEANPEFKSTTLSTRVR